MMFRLEYTEHGKLEFTHLPECKTSKKISFMAPTRKIEFDHVIDTRKH